LGSSPRTLVAWILPTGYPDSTYNGIIAYGGGCTGHGCLLSIKNDGRLSMAFWCDDAHQTSGPTVSSTEYTFVGFIFDGDRGIKFLMNGEIVDEKSVASTPDTTAPGGGLRVGCTDWPGRHFQGYIDEVFIFSQALEPSEMFWMRSVE
jgi:hypothetical protein